MDIPFLPQAAAHTPHITTTSPCSGNLTLGLFEPLFRCVFWGEGYFFGDFLGDFFMCLLGRVANVGKITWTKTLSLTNEHKK